MKISIVDLPDTKTVLFFQGQTKKEHRQLLALARELRKLGLNNYTCAVNVPRHYSGVAINL